MESEIIFRIWNGESMEETKLDNEFDCISGWLDDRIINLAMGDVDRKGKKLFAGDIIEFAINPHNHSEGLAYDIIVHEEAAWMTKEKRIPLRLLLGYFGPLSDRFNCKVRQVGNIYETPELIALTLHK
jgi:uncharacterized phage protein (TIGR01671 family)